MTRSPQLLRWLDDIPLLSKYGLYRWLMFVAVGLALAMALLSATDKQVHHDEYDHINAARFYFEHWLPPGVGDMRARDAYSLYGRSYLDEWDIVYPLAGKFAKLISPAVSNDAIALRLFNVGLFFVLACIAFVRRDDILAFALLLTSPQIWYVFSYFNGDAFPMFVSFLVALALTSPRSLFNAHTRSAFVRYLPLGICLGLLLLSKKTFWAFGLFAICCAAWREFVEYRHARTMGAFFQRSGILAAIILMTALPRIGYDLFLNGAPAAKAARIAETAEATATPYFKPSANLNINLSLKRKGVTIVQMMKPSYRWAEVSAISAFGYYNYNTVRMGPSYYRLMFGTYAFLLIYLVIAVSARGKISDRILVVGGYLFCFLVIGLSLYHSWVNDYQPQGRYLFGIFSILAVVLARSKRMLDPAVINLVLLLCFFASVYSFCAAGLGDIPRFMDIAEMNIHFRRQ